MRAELVGNEAETTPEVRRVEFAGGAELVYRDLSRLRQERAHVLLTTLKVSACGCGATHWKHSASEQTRKAGS